MEVRVLSPALSLALPPALVGTGRGINFHPGRIRVVVHWGERGNTHEGLSTEHDVYGSRKEVLMSCGGRRAAPNRAQPPELTAARMGTRAHNQSAVLVGGSPTCQPNAIDGKNALRSDWIEQNRVD
jgi:hypothetical protein